MGNEICIVIKNYKLKGYKNDTLGFIVYEPKISPA